MPKCSYWRLFNIDDYKLPEYENENNNFAQENYNQPINSFNPIDLNNNDNNVSDSVNLQNQYQYVEDNPNYTSVDMPQGVSSIDDVINILRNTLDTIKNGKLRVDTEEIDYDDSYQITIRIDKKRKTYFFSI